MYEMIY